MAEDSQASSGEIEVKLSIQSNTAVGDNEKQSLTNGNTDLPGKEGNKEEDEESASDGEFVKVEKQTLVDVEESSHLFNPIVEVEGTSHTTNHESGNSEANVNFIKMKEKIKELELQLETVLGKLKSSEDEKTLLNSEFDLANDKLEKMNKHCEELEVGQKLMENQMLEAEQKYNFQLESLREALKAADMKDKELIDARKSFAGLSTELDSSRKRIKALEEELLSSVGELNKLEELSKHSSSRAELESRKNLELEKMLELAHVNEKEMEDEIGNLQKELKELHNEIAKKLQVEEALGSTSLELSISQEKLEISKSQVAELEQKLASKDAFVHELTEELNLHKVSHEQLRADVTELENMLTASKEDIQTKLVNLEELEQKLQEQVKEREAVESCFKNQEVQISSLRNDLSDLNREKVTLENTVADLNTKLLENEELHSHLEAKLNLADQEFKKTDSLLSQELSHKEDLEKKLELLEQLHHESRTATEAATKRSLEIEDLVQSSNAAEEDLRAKLKETEMRLVFSEKSNMELEQQKNCTEIKYLDAETEIKDLNKKITEFTALMKEVDEQNAILRHRFEGYEDRIDQLESSLSKSSLRNTELEKELNDLLKKCVEHEERATATHHCSLELEDLIHSSHSRAEDAEKRAGELELLLESADSRTQELEQLLSITEAKHREVEAQSKQYSSKVSELVTELETCQARSATLEAGLQAANEKERELTDILNIATGERKKFEGLSNSHAKKFYESENQIQIMQNELKYLKEKVESAQEELEASSVRERELLEKLRYSGEQLEHHGKAIEEVTARNLELNSLNESLVKDSELKLQETAASFKKKESEAKDLLEKLKYLEEQLAFYKEEAVEATENVTSLKAELGENALELVSLQNSVEELKHKVSEANLRCEQTFAENELLATSNSKLRDKLEAHQHKVNELNELLNSTHSEKEATVEQLASHASTIARLTDENSRGLELQFATESHLRENEAQLHEAIEKHKQRDLEARDLQEKLLELETQLRTYEEQASESTVVAATQTGKLEEALFKLLDLEGLVEQLKSKSDQFKLENEGLARHNQRLSEELAIYETKMNKLRVAFDAAVTEKEDISMQLHSSKKEMEDLMQQLNSDKEQLQSQITSVMEKKNMLKETYQNAKKELEATIVHLEEQLSKQKARETSLDSLVESLKEELSEKSFMQARISELEEELKYAGEQLEHHGKVVEEVTARNLDLNSLNDSLVKDSELKLQEAAASFKQKDSEAKELLEKLNSLEEQLTFYKEQAAEATENVASLKAELGENAMELVSLENNIEELKKKASEANRRSEQAFAENELLATSNSKLREELETHQHKVNELNELLKSIHAEKEATVVQLASHESTIARLTDEHSRGLELQLATESHLKENEAQLHEFIEKHKQRDSEARDLQEKLLALETQLRTYEEQASESVVVAATQKGKLEEALFKLEDLEGLVEQLNNKSDQFKFENEDLARHNQSLSEELATYKTKMNELQELFDTAVTEKEDISMQLHSSKKEMEDLMHLLNSDKEKLQSQITSVMEEKSMLNEMYQNAKKELEATIVHLEEKLSEQKARETSLDSLVESLKEELPEKSLMQARIAKLEEELRYAGEQLEHHGKAVEEVTARNLELNSLNDSLVKDSEFKLQEAAASFKQKDSEAKELLQRLKSLEKQLVFYREQAAEATENVTSLQSELGENAMKLDFLENNVEELKQQVSEANLRGEQTFADNEFLATANSKLREELETHQHKVNELNELLKSIHAEKEATVDQLATHASIIEKLTDEHSRGLELQFATEYRLKENEAQLHEAIEKHKQRDLEARDLQEKLLALETQLRSYEEQASESAVVAASQERKLEEALLKLQDLEGLVEQLESKLDQSKTENEGLTRHNQSLSRELATYETKMNELQVALDAAVTGKEDISVRLQFSKKEMEDHMQLLVSDREKLQSQITSVMEENSMLNEMYQNARKELEATIIQLEEKLSEQKAREFSLDSLVENLKAELSEKSLMQAELEQKLKYAGEQLEHHREVVADVTAKNLELNLLNESLVKDSELKLQEAAASFKQKESEAKKLLEKLTPLGEQLAFYKEQADTSTENVTSLKAELETNAMKLVSLENNIEELQKKVSEANQRGEQTLAENELLATSNSKLREELETHQHKVNELNELLKSIHAEKEVTVVQLASHASTVARLTDEHSRGLELQLETESRLKENEAQLNESIEKHKQRDSEARDLQEKLLALETQLRTHEERASKSAAVAASQKGKLEEALFKLEDLEGLVEQLKRKSDQFKFENEDLARHNQSLSEELATYETKMNKLQVAFDTAVTEKEDISMELHSSKKEMEDLMQLFNSDKEKLQLQITSIMEENNLLNQMYQNSRKELEATIVQLKENLSEQKAREVSLNSLAENLKAELSEKSLMQAELQQKLRYAEEQLEHHGKAVEEVTARNMELNSLNESLVKDSELKLQEASASFYQKESEAKELIEKLNSLEEQLAFYEKQAAEATENATSLKVELGENTMKLVFLENYVEELKQKVSEANLRGEQTLTENELLATSNSRLREELEAHHHEVSELNEKITMHTASLKELDEENAVLRHHFETYEDRINKLESSLSNSSLRNSELEKELNDLLKKCVEHEERATATHHRSLELEDLIHSSHSRAEDSEKRAGELELLLEASNYRTQELEQLLSILEEKYRDVEAESKQHGSKVSELVMQLEACQARSATLEAGLQAANEKERGLTDILNITIEERKKFEDLSNSQEKKIYESENQIQILQNELKYLKEKVESVQEELEASSVREKEQLENLRYAEEQLEHHGKAVEEVTARNMELNSLNESLVKDSELKLQEASASFYQKESEAKELIEKLNSLEEQLAFYEKQAAEATENATSLKVELGENTMKLVFLENYVEELKQKVSEANLRGEQTLTENELLATSNSRLREELEAHHHEVSELNEKITMHTASLKELDEENAVLRHHFETYEDRINKLESSLSNSSLRNSELEKELNDLLKKCVEHEERATATHHRSLELEDLIHSSHSRAEDSEKRAGELELLLEASNYRTQELEQLLSILEEKYRDVEAESKQHGSKVSELVMQLEACQARSATLEAGLQAANEKERGLTDILNITIEERKKFEDLSNSQEKKIYESENQIQILQNELKYLKEKVESVQEELEASSVREKEQLENLRYAEEQLEHHGKAVEEVTARNMELNSLNESLVKDSELKLQEASASFYQKESEAKELIEKLNSLEEQLAFYEKQAAEATENATSLKVELGENTMKLVFLENYVEELKQKVSEANLRGEQTLTENELLATSNSRLREELEAHHHEVSELNEKITMHTASLKELDEENAVLRHHFETYEDRINKLESSLSNSSLRNSELEKELNDLLKKCVEHEERATATHHRSLELEDLIHSSHSRAEDSEKRAGELELLLEASNYRTQELEQLLSILEEKYRDVEAESKQHGSKVSELVMQLEACQARSATLEAGLQAANEKERGLTDILNITIEERKKFEDLSNSQEKKIYESENQIQILQNELKYLKEKVESVQEEFEASSVREKEQLEKLRYAEEQLEHHGKAVEEVTARNMELNSLNESLVKDSELKLQEASASFYQKESEAKELIEKLNSLEEQLAFYEKQAAEATENATSLKVELGENTMKLVFLENYVEELKQKVSEANLRGEQTLTENELLATSNSKLREELEAHQHEVSELNEKITMHTASLKELDEENAVLRHRFEASEDRINKLESSLSNSSLRNSELEKELNDLLKKCVEHEEWATATHHRSLELEDLIHSSHSRAEDSEKRAGELKLSLEAANYRTQELEQLLSILEEKHRDVEAESKQHGSKVSELVMELEAYQARSATLEAGLQAANEKERGLTDILNITIEERKKFEDLSNSQEKKIYESENQIQILQNELKYLNEKVESVQEELEASSVREKEQLEKLRYAEEQLEHHGKAVEEVTARNMELNSLNESLVKDSELKLQEASASFYQKESEAKELIEKLNSLEEQLAFYEKQAAEATENATSLKVELGENTMKLVFLENYVEELKQKVSEANLRGEQTLTENELLATSNSKLREELEAHQHKVNELNELLKSIHVEKEATVEQLASHASTIAKLNDECSRGLELQFATESRLKENDAQLHEAIEKHKQKDLEARDLQEKLLALETQVRTYEEQANESAVVAAIHKGKLEEALLKLQDLGGLVEQLESKLDQFKTENEGLVRYNLSLSEELAINETKINELQVELDAAVTEKEVISMQLHSSKNKMENLMQVLNSEKGKLQSQITSVMEENNLLNEMYQNARQELEATKSRLEEKLSEQKAREFSLGSLVEDLKAELSEKYLMQAQISELEQKLRYAREQLEHQRKSLQEVTARNLELNSSNESLVNDSELKLQEATAIFKQKESEAKELLEKLKSLEEQLAFYKEQAVEATENVASLKVDLEANAMILVSLENNIEELKKKVSEANLRGEQTFAENELLAISNSKLREELEAHQHEVRELSEKIAELTASLKEVDDENVLWRSHFEGYEDRIHQLEYSLSKSSSRNSELEKELNDLLTKCVEHEEWATSAHQRSLELEDLIHLSRSRAEAAEKRAGELELLLEAANYRTQELEQLLSILEEKHRDVEAESKQHGSKVSELVMELEAYQARSATLEAGLQAANEKERGLTDILNITIIERKKFEDLSNSQEKKIYESENQIQILQNELKYLKEKVESVQEELEASSVREKEQLEKLRYAEERLEHHGKSVEEVSARNLELNSLNESLVKDSELKLQEASASFYQKESEAKELIEKLNSLEEQLTFYEKQAAEATENATSLKVELGENTMRLVFLENNVEELKQKVSETNLRSEQTLTENEVLATSNSKLREELEAHQHKVNELNELLKSIHSEKEATVEQLASHANTIANLTDKHSRSLELQLEAESRLKENEAQLHEAIEKHKQRDLEARYLQEKLLALEIQLKTYEEQASESAVVAESQKGKLEEALFKLQDLDGLVEQLKSESYQFKFQNEGLARHNLSLSGELSTYEIKMNELQVAFDAAVTEKEDMSMKLHSSKKEMEDLMQLLNSDKEKLQSQITSFMEENIVVNEMYRKAVEEHVATIVQLEEKLSEQRARELSLNSLVENLKTELSEKSLMQARISELEQKLFLAGAIYTQEIESMVSAVAEKDAVLTAKLEHTSLLQERDSLDKQLKETSKELALAQRTLTEQKELDSTMEFETRTSIKQPLNALESKNQHAALLEKQVEELEQKMQEAKTQYRGKVIEERKKLALLNMELNELRLKLSKTTGMEKKITELENALRLACATSVQEVKNETSWTEMQDLTEVKSRDLGLDTLTLLNRKSKKTSDRVHQDTEATDEVPNEHADIEPSVAMAFKFILGVALVSMIIGVILGKRY